ncbi:MAG: glycerol kinase GlpK [bacterium]
MKNYILSIDAGTTSSRAIIFDKSSKIVAMAQKEFAQIYPKPGWVEHDPVEIWNTQLAVIRQVLADSKIDPKEIATIGITNQRETTVVWNKLTGKPVYNAIVWQCRRTADICKRLKEKGLEEKIKSSTGLVVDAYFSATKLHWILENVPNAKKDAENGKLLFGTIDSWILFNLTKGKVHATDVSNASRTMMYDIEKLKWDDEILKELDIPKTVLPKVLPSSADFGFTDKEIFYGHQIPVTGIAGDQQASLFGQVCFKKGAAKNTYGTGCFLMMNTGNEIVRSDEGLLTTIGWQIGDEVTYALEGSIFIGGAVIQWLRDELKLLNTAKESEYFATEVKDNGGVYIVPAFVGLGTPYWDPYARGIIAGLTRGVNKNHIIRAALESICYQTKDVFEAIHDECGLQLTELKVDGGASSNNFLMQFQSDMLGVPVYRPVVIETTALGAAYLAGLYAGIWKNSEEISKNWKIEKVFGSLMSVKERNGLFKNWKKAVERSKKWEEEK